MIHTPTIERERLMFVRRFMRRPQHRVAEAHAPVDPHVLGVRAAIGHEPGHSLQEVAVDRSAVRVDDADDAAHRAFGSIGVIARSNAAKS